MDHARRATPADAGELIRLRKVMLDSHTGVDPDISWQRHGIADLRARLGDPASGLAAYVVGRPGGGLASGAIGMIDHRLPGPGNPLGLHGHVFSVATDPDMRRRGHSRACMEGLLGWFRERGAAKVELRASADAVALYASLGFVAVPDPSMRLTLETAPSGSPSRQRPAGRL
ncbi:GNAT family N-acetyltransferase [Streptomyces sp. NPDC001889]